MSCDIPAFPGFFDHSKLVAGSSLLAAELVSQKEHDVVLNWMGGLHHARKSKASGFCYTNDCVLAIVRLLHDFQRVLYVDIDVHHGDGVEEAFLKSNRVMTLSLHLFDPEENFFPGTGSLEDKGFGEGMNYAVNVPLRRGCSDISYEIVFKAAFDRVTAKFKPDAIVLQCGADSLIGDLIGPFNVSLQGHSDAFMHVIEYGVPTVVLGGGGYTLENVSRCWTIESAKMVNKELPNQIPENLEYSTEYSSPELFYNPQNIHNANKDLNTKNHLHKIIETIDQNLQEIESAPGCVLNSEIPDIENYSNRLISNMFSINEEIENSQ